MQRLCALWYVVEAVLCMLAPDAQKPDRLKFATLPSSVSFVFHAFSHLFGPPAIKVWLRLALEVSVLRSLHDRWIFMRFFFSAAELKFDKWTECDTWFKGPENHFLTLGNGSLKKTKAPFLSYFTFYFHFLFFGVTPSELSGFIYFHTPLIADSYFIVWSQ